MGANTSTKSEKKIFTFHFQISSENQNEYSSDRHIGPCEKWKKDITTAVNAVLLQSYRKTNAKKKGKKRNDLIICQKAPHKKNVLKQSFSLVSL